MPHPIGCTSVLGSEPEIGPTPDIACMNEECSWLTLHACRNNDKTVKIFSLPQSRLLSTLEFLFHMNHASIRPDGEILAAVGDDAYGIWHLP